MAEMDPAYAYRGVQLRVTCRGGRRPVRMEGLDSAWSAAVYFRRGDARRGGAICVLPRRSSHAVTATCGSLSGAL